MALGLILKIDVKIVRMGTNDQWIILAVAGFLLILIITIACALIIASAYIKLEDKHSDKTDLDQNQHAANCHEPQTKPYKDSFLVYGHTAGLANSNIMLHKKNGMESSTLRIRGIDPGLFRKFKN